MSSGGGSLNKYDWFLGSSLYLELTVDYSQKKIGSNTFYRMEKITSKYSVNSGTIVTAAALNFGVQGVGEDGNPVYKQENYDITYSGNPYSTTAPSFWAYARQGDMMGAGFQVYAKRPGGNANSYSVAVSVFN